MYNLIFYFRSPLNQSKRGKPFFPLSISVQALWIVPLIILNFKFKSYREPLLETYTLQNVPIKGGFSHSFGAEEKGDQKTLQKEKTRNRSEYKVEKERKESEKETKYSKKKSLVD